MKVDSINFEKTIADLSDTWNQVLLPGSFNYENVDSDRDGVPNYRDCQPFNSSFQDSQEVQETVQDLSPTQPEGFVDKIRSKLQKYRDKQSRRDEIIRRAYQKQYINELRKQGSALAKKRFSKKDVPVPVSAKVGKGGMFAGQQEVFFGSPKKAKKSASGLLDIDLGFLENLNFNLKDLI